MSATRTLVPIAISFIATLLAIPAWMISYIVVITGMDAGVNSDFGDKLLFEAAG